MNCFFIDVYKRQLLLVLAVVLLFTSLFFGLSYVRERRKMKMRFNKFRR
ncbi:small membrane protein [Klebsiella pneumoniae]|nr:small membrane protein [Klebsiella pneumoniae]